jgi:hypothetical protein
MDPAEPMHRIEPAEPMDWIDATEASHDIGRG